VAASMHLLLPQTQSDHFVCLLPFHNTVSLDQTSPVFIIRGGGKG
jgi:hypothetical protein